MLNNIDIQNIIPHRYPFLLVDKIVEINPGQKAVGIKNVTINEPFFQGHFPGNPIMPGVLQVEALAQVGAVAVLSMEENKGKLAVFTGIDKLRFKRQVVPGDTLRLEVEIIKMRRNIGTGQAVAYVGDEVACKGEIMFALVEQE
ncbi:3-hydroxyacyl-[acyl-carrier-protein] dehydratase [Caminicella sporogenes DSM 14501]|uniref:3-hydroxyacyl-[acyl-carrier-protein] dehydratase FabZ n=1 Tax=Caminicella sporogenes DSM 14501 TaxID=1121266 RepID=A0A1M6PVB7_9FIRM|nr:3-hydroxyacyl-ACP dehydratase FabZ [Caminicella sporogenes]RKD21957.1 3-hydroxyacyl-[acyl-carrier-protein] dehydratase FabZ [Caminicella sporogenes]SHK11866.1 3-hydroxyacyl-[acyl-carrier-protein] dehydratase [Caminicella sporogenes DSM 14501]